MVCITFKGHPPAVMTPELNRMVMPRLSQENLSPRQQTYGLASCLSTPPRSPFVAPNHKHLSVCRGKTISVWLRQEVADDFRFHSSHLVHFSCNCLANYLALVKIKMYFNMLGKQLVVFVCGCEVLCCSNYQWWMCVCTCTHSGCVCVHILMCVFKLTYSVSA